MAAPSDPSDPTGSGSNDPEEGSGAASTDPSDAHGAASTESEQHAARANDRSDGRLFDGDHTPDPKEAAEPDDVIRQPEDIEPDKADGESGEARRVDPEGRTKGIQAEERDRKRAALVYNPIKVDKERLRDLVTSRSEEAGWDEPLFFETTVDDLGDDVTRQALDDGVDVVLVAGGDGTVRAVSEAMAGSGTPLSIVPSGTGNLLARNLELPLSDPAPMVDAAFTGDTFPVDVGRAHITRGDGSKEDHAFVVMAGIGLDAAMIANTNPQLKKTVGWVAYVDGAARALPKAKPFRVAYQVDERRLHSARVQSVLFANCGALPGGIALIPEASVADGTLDVCVFQPAGWFGWLAVWRKVWWDNSVLRRFRAGRRVLERRGRDESVRYFHGGSFELATTPGQPIELDGDEFGEATSIRCSIEKGALIAVVPSGHDTSSL